MFQPIPCMYLGINLVFGFRLDAVAEGYSGNACMLGRAYMHWQCLNTPSNLVVSARGMYEFVVSYVIEPNPFPSTKTASALCPSSCAPTTPSPALDPHPLLFPPLPPLPLAPQPSTQGMARNWSCGGCQYFICMSSQGQVLRGSDGTGGTRSWLWSRLAGMVRAGWRACFLVVEVEDGTGPLRQRTRPGVELVQGMTQC